MREAGAIVLGKTATHEFAWGFSSINDALGTVRNPRDPERVAGGSSGGSAAALAAGLAPLALGTDTGGSIRVPSAFCGTYGLKPTFGRVSLDGRLAARAHARPRRADGAHAEDLALLLGVLAPVPRHVGRHAAARRGLPRPARRPARAAGGGRPRRAGGGAGRARGRASPRRS